MRQGGGQLSHGGYPAYVCEIRLRLAQSLFSLLAVGEIDHETTHARYAISLHNHSYQVAQPHHTSVGSDHTVFKLVVAFLGGCGLAVLQSPLPVFWMHMVLPECRFGQPAFHRVAQDALGLLADERKLETRHIRFPNNRLDRINQVAEPLLCSYCFGEGRSLTCQQSLALFIHPLAFGNVYRCTDVLNEIAGYVENGMT